MRDVQVPYRFAAAVLFFAVTGCEPAIPTQAESGFEMASDSLSFQNFAHGYVHSKLDPESMVRMFGVGVCANAASPCTLKPAAKAWMNKANSSMSGGRCEGFAVLSSLFFSKDLQVENFGGTDARSLSLASSPELQRELAYWFATQMVPEVVGEKTTSYMAKDVMTFLAKALRPDATEQFRLGIVKKVGKKISGGHAVTPIGFQKGPTDGVYLLRVYDNNNPDTERTITIDTKNNRWEYEAARNPNEKSSLFFGDDTNQNPMYFAPVRNRLGTLPCGFCEKGKNTEVQTSGSIQATFNTAAGATGVQDGELVTTGGGSVTPSFSGFEDGLSAFTISLPASDELSVSLKGDPLEAGAGSLSAFGPGYSISIANLTLKDDQADSLEVRGGGKNLTYANRSRTPLTVSTAIERENGQVVEVSASLSGASDAVEVELDPETGKVGVNANGASGTAVTVVITETSPEGESRSGQLSFEAGQEGALAVDLSTWTEDGPLTGTVDDGSGTPKVVTDGCRDGAKNGQESDVDCGGICPAACSVGSGCAAAADCLSGFCNGLLGSCVATACEDGVKSGQETDVDCGGAGCAACDTGKVCAADSDCTSGACRSERCVSTFALGAAVSGLPAGATLTLQNNGGDDLEVNGDGTFQFLTRIVGAYDVTVARQPGVAFCAVTSGSGIANADVQVTVTCSPRWQISGAVSGLPVGESVTLQNNGADTVSVSVDGSFFFPTLVEGNYAVTIATQPTNASCVVQNGSGTATADVSNVQVVCASLHPISGTLSGLPAGGTVVLQNNGGDFLTRTVNGAFSFATRVTGPYSVTVATQPAGATCTVQNGNGVATGPVTDVQVTCVSGFLVGGTVTGLPSGQNLTLQNNGGDSLPVTANGSFTFSTRVSGAYAVTVATQPSGASCSVANGSGMASADVSDVTITCLASGSFDNTYGSGGQGWVRYQPTGFHNEWYSVVVNPDGTHVWVGRDQVGGSDEDWVITKLTNTGALDGTFGSGGTLRIGMGAAIGERARVVRRLSDGSLLVAGRFWNAGFDVGVAKVTPSGTLDATFGTNGVITHNLGSDETVEDLYVYPDNSMVLVGRSGDGVAAAAVCIRLTAAGALDTTFGGGTGVMTYNPAGDDQAMAVTVTASGQIAVAGFSDNDSFLLLLAFDGQFDPTFGAGGQLLVDLSGAGRLDQLRRIVLEPSGTLLVGGVTSNGTNDDVLLARYSLSGTLVSTLGTTGVVALDRAGRTDSLRALQVLPDGKLLLGGGTNEMFLLGRLTAAGAVDTAFGTSGFVESALGGNAATLNDLALDPQGRILGGGNFGVSNPDLGSARFNP